MQLMSLDFISSHAKAIGRVAPRCYSSWPGSDAIMAMELAIMMLEASSREDKMGMWQDVKHGRDHLTPLTVWYMDLLQCTRRQSKRWESTIMKQIRKSKNVDKLDHVEKKAARWLPMETVVSSMSSPFSRALQKCIIRPRLRDFRLWC